MAVEEARREDEDFERIHFSENFRRAKRNALFWSAATMLLAVGSTSHRSDSVEVSTIAVNLTFGQGFLTFASTTVLIFMLFGYYRAEAILLAQHTGFAFADGMREAARSAKSLVEMMEKLASTIQRHEEELDNSIHKLQKSRERIKRELEEILPKNVEIFHSSGDGDQGVYPIEISNILKDLWNDPSPENSPDRTNRIRKIAGQLQDSTNKWLSSILRTAQSRLNRTLNIDFGLPSEAAQMAQVATSNPRISIDMLSGLESSLNGFSNTIGSSERRWFWLYDRGVVWILAFFAIALGIWRIVDPSSLSACLDLLFPRNAVIAPEIVAAPQQSIT